MPRVVLVGGDLLAAPILLRAYLAAKLYLWGPEWAGRSVRLVLGFLNLATVQRLLLHGTM